MYVKTLKRMGILFFLYLNDSMKYRHFSGRTQKIEFESEILLLNNLTYDIGVNPRAGLAIIDAPPI